MTRRLSIASILVTAFALAVLVAGLRSEGSSASEPTFATTVWGSASCEANFNNTDAVAKSILYQVASFTNYQPNPPADCPKLRENVYINGNAHQWGNWNCDHRYDFLDVLFALRNAAGLTTHPGDPIGPAGILCFDWGDIVEPAYVPPADDSLDLLAIDTNTAGNAPNSLGALDVCRSVSVGQTFDVDVVVKGVPAVTGLYYFDHDFRYDPAVLQFVGYDPYQMIAANNPDHTGIEEYVDFGAFSFDIITGQPIPGSPNGDAYPTVTDHTNLTLTPESGDGVLIRYTMKALAPGTSALTLHQFLRNDLYPPTIGGIDFKPYEVPDKRDATIRVGTPCGPTPSPSPSLTPSPIPSGGTPTPTSTPTAPASETPTSTPSPDEWDCPIVTPQEVPDGVPEGVTISSTNSLAGNIEDMQVCLEIDTEFPGDVVATLTHEETSHTVILIDRLGNHAGTCEGTGTGIHVYLTDDPSSGMSMEDRCHDPGADEDIIGEFYADQYLADENFANTFDGEAIAGTWTLKVSDENAGNATTLTGVKLYFTAE